MRKLISSLLALMLVFSLAIPAFAASGSVTFQGKKDKFSFDPGSSYSSSDLFGDLKEVMPGDEITETIKVTNKSRDADSIKIYLRAEAHDASNTMVSSDPEYGKDYVEMNDFLSQLNMRVYNGDKLIYEGSPDEENGLSKNVLLGTLRRNRSLTLTVELEVPIELGNEYANRVGEVDWVFTVEAYDDPDVDNPKTGDYIMMAVAVMAVSAAAIAILVFFYKKNKKKDK